MKLFVLKCLPLENRVFTGLQDLQVRGGGEGQTSTLLQQLITFECLYAFLTQTGILGGGESVLMVGAGVALNSDAQWTKISLF